MVVNRFTIRMHNRCNILGTLHPTFDFQRVNPRIKELRYKIYCIQITRREEKVACGFSQHIFSLRINHGVRQTAGLCTAPAIPAAAADHTAHQTLPRIADTKRAMHEALDLNMCIGTYMANFRNAKFTRQNNTRKSKFL